MQRKNGCEVLVHEFWAYDPATDIALEILDNLGIPYRVNMSRRLRDPSAPRGCRYDDWAEIYIEVKKLAKWAMQKIEEEINNC